MSDSTENNPQAAKSDSPGKKTLGMPGKILVGLGIGILPDSSLANLIADRLDDVHSDQESLEAIMTMGAPVVAVICYWSDDRQYFWQQTSKL